MTTSEINTAKSTADNESILPPWIGGVNWRDAYCGNCDLKPKLIVEQRVVTRKARVTDRIIAVTEMRYACPSCKAVSPWCG